jgi:hypothetical protein
MSDRLTVILPPVLTAEGRIAEALNYSSLAEGDGYGVGSGSGYGSGDGYGHGDGDGYGLGDGTGRGDGYGYGRGDGKSSVHIE